MDPRIERRRRNIRENRLHRRLRTILWLCVLGAVVGLGAWVLQSPLLDVRTIAVYGVQHSDVARILQDAGLEEGTPMIRVNPRTLVELLEADPWVAAAKVERTFPHTVEVDVMERTIAAGLTSRGGWVMLSTDGVVLGPEDTLPEGAARLVMASVDSGPAGGTPTNKSVKGALSFVNTLSLDLRGQTEIEIQDDELWATVGSVSVRLGAPLDMEAKARALEALLESGVPENAVINLIAPSRPAVETSS